ncbi:PAS domain S-box protein, partial [Stenotrophomonas maltophilia]|uniref:PAS domain S-box protein n=1 Tax=Stenotrophomonas maltophilia TaxID=40324 RepID=UPI0034DAF04F
MHPPSRHAVAGDSMVCSHAIAMAGSGPSSPGSEAGSLGDDANLRAMMRTVLDGLIIIDSAGVIEMFNPAAEGIFGYTPNEVIGENVRMLMPEPDRSAHDGYLA